ncbi:TIGR01777 family oxidoreductase [Ruficoccus sp. ZRK36]|uniref:TIGR01777 family oxidoreductase n=1 Tax=Ruficoccus sp. ZRK36 TaxID=2866311 RepID=UPI001C72F450|nr:TIGR01777 family oxidoreductase [Ruficoccus sp. ZRK36]QYY37226.1 TIGR01777 family oxidoreductase [Ruficoccus sp. ZRK36]
MKVAIAGGTGLIGKALQASLKADGHSCLVLSRSPEEGQIAWDPTSGEIDWEALNGVDAVVNLAGRNIASRWSESVKREIRESRVEGTALLARTLAQLDPKPRVFINASAIGYYGVTREEELTEEASAGGGFLAEVCREWEAAAEPAAAAGVRTVLLRNGVVLSPEGGALAKILTPFRAGLGGPVGDGKQWMSWIALDDVVGLIRFCIEHESIRGPVNVTAPAPVTNAELATTLGEVLDKPSSMPTPAFAIKLAFGQMADETLLSSVRVLPAKAEAAGYVFRFPALKPALEHLLS